MQDVRIRERVGDVVESEGSGDVADVRLRVGSDLEPMCPVYCDSHMGKPCSCGGYPASEQIRPE
jgi:hypothetical protein